MKFNYKEIHIGTMIKQLVLEKESNEDRIANFLKADTVVIDRMYEKKRLMTKKPLNKYCNIKKSTS